MTIARTVEATAYRPDRGLGPGRLTTVELDVERLHPAELVLPEACVREERADDLLGTDPVRADLHFAPRAGGGPLADGDTDREARAFGLVNTAFHVQRALRLASELLGRPLPRLVVRIGTHPDRARWGGGHYRLPGHSAHPPEHDDLSPDGEIHLGVGGDFLTGPDGHPYRAAPSHNAAIVYHEVGHHICRHTADFRLNGARPADEQTNKKVAVDEGTADVFAAILLRTPDIYRWHRAQVPAWDRRRRLLDPRWTMATFQGGSTDPHADGTVWASACWSARRRVEQAGHPARRFDRMLLRGLDLLGWEGRPAPGERPDERRLRNRRHVGGLLDAMLRADPELDRPVRAAMAGHGIRPGRTNAVLREAARAEITGPG